MMARWGAIKALQRRLATLNTWRAEGNVIVAGDEGDTRMVGHMRDPNLARLVVDMRQELVYIINVLMKMRQKEEDWNRLRRYSAPYRGRARQQENKSAAEEDKLEDELYGR